MESTHGSARRLLEGCPYLEAQRKACLPILDDRALYGVEDMSRSPPTLTDTYDGRHWIDATGPEAPKCQKGCLCHTFSSQQGGRAVRAFSISRHHTGMTIRILSSGLQWMLINLGLPLDEGRVEEKTLWRYKEVLNQALKNHEEKLGPMKERNSLPLNTAERILLVHELALLVRVFLSSTRNDLPPLQASIFDFWDWIEPTKTMEASYFDPLFPSEAFPDFWCFRDRDSHLKDALMNAILTKNHRTARYLIETGADVNKIMGGETPLSLAARAESSATVKLLLEYGADPQTAFVILHDKTRIWSRRWSNFLAETAAQCSSQVVRRRAIVSRRMVRLYFEFVGEHSHIMQAARVSGPVHHPEFHQPPSESHTSLEMIKEWAEGMDQEYRKAWKTGIGTLRKLCSGTVPRRLDEIIMFIAVARVMMVIMNDEDRNGLLVDFSEDVSRWQVLFDSEQRNLFVNAVKDIWNVDIQDCPSRLKPTVDDLEQFQSLALELMETAQESFGLDDLEECSEVRTHKTRWGPNTQPDQDGTRIEDHESEAAKLSEFQPSHSVPQDPKVDNPRTGSAGDSQDNNCCFSPQELITIIMAGIIFGCVFAFLLATCSPAFMGISDPLTAYHTVLQVSSAQILDSVCTKLETQPYSPDGIALAAIREFTFSMISAGHVYSFASLKLCFEVGAEFLFQQARDFLLIECDKRYYAIQMAFSSALIESWLESPHNGCRSGSEAQSFTAGKNGNPDVAASVEPQPVPPPLLQDVSSGGSTPVPIHSAGAEGHSSTRSSFAGSDIQSHAGTSSAPESSPNSDTQRKKRFTCTECSQDFSSSSNFHKHMRGPKHINKRSSCNFCQKTFLRDDYRRKHEQKQHSLLRTSRRSR